MPDPPPPVQGVVDDDGFTVSGWAGGADGPAGARTVEVLVQGRRVWSVTPSRDGRQLTPGSSAWRVTWPRELRARLRGSATVALRDRDTRVVLHSEERVFRAGEGVVEISDGGGRPLALDKSLRLVSTFEHQPVEQKHAFLAGMRRVLTDLEELGAEVFLAYGTLLGAVREQDVIPHDNDADVGYLSRYSHPFDVAAESMRLQRGMVERGWPVERYSGAAFRVDVYEGDRAPRGVDVFAGFLRGGELCLLGELIVPFEREWLVPREEASLDGVTFPVPADPDRLLTQSYGPSWRDPDPTFTFRTPRHVQRRFDGWFRGLRDRRVIWERYYHHLRLQQDTPTEEPSALARDAVADLPDGAGLVDVGCGRGSDVFWAAREGVPAVGLDLVPHAFRRRARHARERGFPAAYHSLNLLDVRDVITRGALLAQEERPRRVLARHVYDAVNRYGREHLLRLARMLTAAGGTLRLEMVEGPSHRVPGGGAGQMLYPPSRRRWQEEVAATGGRVLDVTETPLAEEDQVAWRLPGSPEDYRLVRTEVEW